jgi:hypothetical protein
MTADPADLRRMADAAAEAYHRDSTTLNLMRLAMALNQLERQDPITAGRLRARVEAAREGSKR